MKYFAKCVIYVVFQKYSENNIFFDENDLFLTSSSGTADLLEIPILSRKKNPILLFST